MTARQLYRQIIAYELKRNYVFGKAYISIPESDFVQFEPYFTKQSLVAWNNFENLRSKHGYLHIHVIRQNLGEVSVHLDRCNPNTHWLLNIPHGFIDVAPYFIWCLITWQKPYTI